jgi:hypothetical protein
MKTTLHSNEFKIHVDEKGQIIPAEDISPLDDAILGEDIHEQLDWNIPEHREAWSMHLRHQGIKGILIFIEKNPPPDRMKEMATLMIATLEFFANKISTDAWEETYAIFPHLRKHPLIINPQTGEITTNYSPDPNATLI